MEAAQAWHDFFKRWPKGLATKGILVTTAGEAIPFAGFLVSPTMVLLDRPAPDSIGARKVLVPFQAISVLKIAEVVKAAPFLEVGFEGKLPT